MVNGGVDSGFGRIPGSTLRGILFVVVRFSSHPRGRGGKGGRGKGEREGVREGRIAKIYKTTWGLDGIILRRVWRWRCMSTSTKYEKVCNSFIHSSS